MHEALKALNDLEQNNKELKQQNKELKQEKKQLKQTIEHLDQIIQTERTRRTTGGESKQPTINPEPEQTQLRYSSLSNKDKDKYITHSQIQKITLQQHGNTIYEKTTAPGNRMNYANELNYILINTKCQQSDFFKGGILSPVFTSYVKKNDPHDEVHYKYVPKLGIAIRKENAKTVLKQKMGTIEKKKLSIEIVIKTKKYGLYTITE